VNSRTIQRNFAVKYLLAVMNSVATHDYLFSPEETFFETD